MQKLVLIVLTAACLVNCRTAKPVVKAEPVQETEAAPSVKNEKNPGEDLTGLWELQRLWGTDNKFTTVPYIAIDFDNKTFTGNTDCNSISGKFITNENYITVDKRITSTKMACPGNIEKSLLSVLLKINKFTVNNNELEMSQNDIVLLKFIKK